jgi:hypothetical protein
LRAQAFDASFSARCRRSSCCAVARPARSAISSSCAALPLQSRASAMAASMRRSIFCADGFAHSHTTHSTASAAIHQRSRIGWRPGGLSAGAGAGGGGHGMPRPRSGAAALPTTGRPLWPNAVADGAGAAGFGDGFAGAAGAAGASDQPANPAAASAPATAAVVAAAWRARPSSRAGAGAPACCAVPQYGQ